MYLHFYTINPKTLISNIIITKKVYGEFERQKWPYKSYFWNRTLFKIEITFWKKDKQKLDSYFKSCGLYFDEDSWNPDYTPVKETLTTDHRYYAITLLHILQHNNELPEYELNKLNRLEVKDWTKSYSKPSSPSTSTIEKKAPPSLLSPPPKVFHREVHKIIDDSSSDDDIPIQSFDHSLSLAFAGANAM